MAVLPPGAVGVPLTVQFVLSVSPAAKLPDLIVHMYGPVPPVTGIVPVYGVFTVPEGRVPPTESAEEAIVILTGPVTVLTGFAESVA